MQYSSLHKRFSSGRLAEVATCVGLWLGMLPAPATPMPPAEPAAAQAQLAAQAQPVGGIRQSQPS